MSMILFANMTVIGSVFCYYLSSLGDSREVGLRNRGRDGLLSDVLYVHISIKNGAQFL